MSEVAEKFLSSMGQIPDLAKAFVAAWGEIEHVRKLAHNPHFKTDYADLEEVLNVLKPALSRNGLALLQYPGQMREDRISMHGVLIHSSGQHISFITELPLGPKPSAQAAGSAYTYARRYQATAIGGMAQVDDDGEEATAAPPAKKAAAKKPAETDAADAAAVSELVAKISATTSQEDLEKSCKDEVKELGDKNVADLYVAKLREHKAKKK